MKAFLNDPELRAFVLRAVEEHRAADRLVKGTYWERGRGCAVGCTLESVRLHRGAETINRSNHALFEPELGIPQMLAWLQDTIFENLPGAQAMEWPGRFLAAPRLGADLSRVGWQFLYWLLTDEAVELVNPGISHPLVRDAVRRCADVLAPLTRGEPVDVSAAWSAARAAWAAAIAAENATASTAGRAAASAANAAWIAARAAWSADSAPNAAARAAAGAAESAAIAAESAALSAERAAGAAERAARAAWSAAGAARAVAWTTMADKLVALMAAAPVEEAA